MKVRKATGFVCEDCEEIQECKSADEYKDTGWICPDTDEATLDEPEHQQGMVCPHGEHFLPDVLPPDGKYQARITCEHCEDTTEELEHKKQDVWVPDCRCSILTEQPEVRDWFVCGECEVPYEEREEAKSCCKD